MSNEIIINNTVIGIVIRGAFNNQVLMTPCKTSEICRFGSNTTVEDIQKRILNTLQRFNTVDAWILAATHYTEDGQFFDIFGRTMYLGEGKWDAYWLKDIKVDLKRFVIGK